MNIKETSRNMPYKIMIVDDEPANLRLLERLFRRDHNVVAASSGEEALRLLEQHDVALLITDQRMPGMTGIELLKRTAEFRPHTVRIILTGYTDVTALVEAINCGQVYKYVTKPWSNDELRLTVSRALEHYEVGKSRHELALANQRLVSRLKEMTRGFVRAIADTLEAKDDYILGHARRVRGYAAAIGRRMGLEDAQLEQLSLSAFLHDIGKIGTPDHILLKPGALTDEERAQMQLHSRRGARMLTDVVDMDEVAGAVLYHHEHYDGTGYPEGLRGEEIPLLSRIILVADAYDAMTSPRPFREACPHEVAIEQLEQGTGGRFDPEVVRAFRELQHLAQIRRSIADGLSVSQLSVPPIASDIGCLTYEELVSHIETEPALAARVLREANTAAATPTARLSVACAVLGGSRLREILAQNSESVQEDEGLWEHSLRCAEAARLIAEQTALIDPEEAYSLGLLHDIGRVLLRSLFPEEMKEMQGFEDDERIEREVAAFGVDHAQVGQWVLESCGVPRPLTSFVQTHHDMMRTNTPAALLLHVANTVAQADNPFKVAALNTIGTERLYMLRLNRHDLFRIHASLDSILEQRLTPVL
jgi:putative nucleotidyltransferase with HDIG domain